MKSLLSNSIITKEVGYFGAAQNPKSSAVLDMAGFDWACCIALYGTLLATGTCLLTAYGGAASSAAVTEYAGAITYTAPATPISDICQVLEVVHPTLRYIKFTMTPGVANAVICGMVVIRGKGTRPLTQVALTTGCLSSALLVTPANA
jgi:hypothetical protein